MNSVNDLMTSVGNYARGMGVTDVLLWVGTAVVVWVLFGEKLKPLVLSLKDTLVRLVPKPAAKSPEVVVSPVVPTAPVEDENAVFFALVTSWKRTRDLAVLKGCDDAVRAADAMFPHLSPTACIKPTTDEVVA